MLLQIYYIKLLKYTTQSCMHSSAVWYVNQNSESKKKKTNNITICYVSELISV